MVIIIGYICSAKMQQRESCLMASFKTVPPVYSFFKKNYWLLYLFTFQMLSSLQVSPPETPYTTRLLL